MGVSAKALRPLYLTVDQRVEPVDESNSNCELFSIPFFINVCITLIQVTYSHQGLSSIQMHFHIADPCARPALNSCINSGVFPQRHLAPYLRVCYSLSFPTQAPGIC